MATILYSLDASTRISADVVGRPGGKWAGDLTAPWPLTALRQKLRPHGGSPEEHRVPASILSAGSAVPSQTLTACVDFDLGVPPGDDEPTMDRGRPAGWVRQRLYDVRG